MYRNEEPIRGEVKSEKGFYVGDICYALNEDVYYGVWGKQNDWNEGCHRDPESGFSFAVGDTAYGDGEYYGSNGFYYGVDAGVIGIVPIELVTKDVEGLGTVHEVPGTATFQFDGGVFDFTLPDGTKIHIDTGSHDEEDWDSDNENGWSYDDEDEEGMEEE